MIHGGERRAGGPIFMAVAGMAVSTPGQVAMGMGVMVIGDPLHSGGRHAFVTVRHRGPREEQVDADERQGQPTPDQTGLESHARETTPTREEPQNSRKSVLGATARPATIEGMKPSRSLGSLALMLLGLGAFLAAAPVRACPFCDAVSLTFAQEIAQSEAAVIAKLVEPPPATALEPAATGPLPKGKFEVVEVLKGGDLVAAAGHAGADAKPIETIMLDEQPIGTTFLLMGVEPPGLVWSSPIRVGERAIAYLKQLGDLPEKGPERLAFFLRHLEDEDETLTRDAYDEFAVAPYDDVKGLKDKLDAARLLAWIENPKVPANRRRLYATMLGICGTPAEAERIAAILEGTGVAADQPEVRNGLDALIACHVALEGDKALDLVDRLFLARDGEGKEVPFTETYAAVMALRFLGEESDLVPRERVLKSLKLLLDEPKLADLVIADLARWQDWSVIDRLVTIFKDAKADNIFVREPIVNYLRACPLPEAAAAVKQLETIDPEAVRRAATLAGLAGIATGADATTTPPGPATAADDTALAKQIGTVVGDEDPGVTATVPPTGTSPAAPPAKPEPTTNWKWVLWAGIVLAVAVLARTLLKPGVSGAA